MLSLREGLTYGKSTLQGGGVDQVAIAQTIAELEAPKLELELVDSRWAATYSAPYAYGEEYLSAENPDAEGNLRPIYAKDYGTPIPFDRVIYDPFAIVGQPIFEFDCQYNNLSMQGGAGTLPDGTPYDLRCGLFELGGLIEIEASQIGDRTLSLIAQITNFDNDSDIWNEYFNVWNTSLIPSTSKSHTFQIESRRLELPLLEYRRQAWATVTARGQKAGDPEQWRCFLSLNMHQNSTQILKVLKARLWARQVRADPSDPDFGKYASVKGPFQDLFNCPNA